MSDQNPPEAELSKESSYSRADFIKRAAMALSGAAVAGSIIDIPDALAAGFNHNGLSKNYPDPLKQNIGQPEAIKYSQQILEVMNSGTSYDYYGAIVAPGPFFLQLAPIPIPVPRGHHTVNGTPYTGIWSGAVDEGKFIVFGNPRIWELKKGDPWLAVTPQIVSPGPINDSAMQTTLWARLKDMENNPGFGTYSWSNLYSEHAAQGNPLPKGNIPNILPTVVDANGNLKIAYPPLAKMSPTSLAWPDISPTGFGYPIASKANVLQNNYAIDQTPNHVLPAIPSN